MDNKGLKIERYGHLNKIETIRSVSFQKLSGTMVLEAPEPFPGSTQYYSEKPGVVTPLYVYFVLEGFADLELIARATQKVRTIFPWDFSAAFCAISINGDDFDAIRVRRLSDFDHIPKLQESYGKVGINFKKSTRNINGKSVITFKKLFQLDQYEGDLYLDRDEKDHGYFTVPGYIEHKEFRDLVKRVKYNWDVIKIDVAQGFFYSNERVEDIVRIYTPEMSLSVLEEIKKQYLLRF